MDTLSNFCLTHVSRDAARQKPCCSRRNHDIRLQRQPMRTALLMQAERRRPYANVNPIHPNAHFRLKTDYASGLFVSVAASSWCCCRAVVTHRLHSLLGNRLYWHTSFQLCIVDSGYRVVDMAEHPCFINAFVGMVITGMIGVVGLIGNSLTFVVFWKGDFKSSTSFLFLSLSLIDSAVLLTAFTFHAVSVDFFTASLPSDLSVYLSVYTVPLVSTAVMATAWVTVLIAVNRYIIVCLPLRASQWCSFSKVKIQLTVVLFSVILFNIPQIFRNRVVHYTRNNGTSYNAYVAKAAWRSYPQFYSVYDNILRTTVNVCLPLLVLTLLTIRLIKAMKAHRRMQAEMQSPHSQQGNSMTFALVIVVIVFIICQTPRFVLHVMGFLGPWSLRVRCSVNIMNNTLIILNSAVNFGIYIVVNKRFRDVLAEHVCSRSSATPVVTDDMMATPKTVNRQMIDGSDTRL